MSSRGIRRDTSRSRQRFTFTLCGEFPRERELLAHLFQLPSGRTGAAALQMIMLGLETAGRTTQVELDDNFPWLPAQTSSQSTDKDAIDSMGNVSFKCQFSLYPHVAEHSRLIAMMATLTNERRADVLRRLSLRGIRIHALGRRLATDAPDRARVINPAPAATSAELTHRTPEDSLPNRYPSEAAGPWAARVEKKSPDHNDDLDETGNEPADIRLSPKSKKRTDATQTSASEEKFPKTRPNSTAQETVETPVQTPQRGDNENRVRSLVFRKSPESSMPDDEISIPARPAEKKFIPDSIEIEHTGSAADQDNGGLLVIMGTPMQEKKSDNGEKNGLAGLAAMMGGFAGMDTDD